MSANPVEPRFRLEGKSINEPFSWPDDGGAKRVEVRDPNWLVNGKPRLVRIAGWRTCMSNPRHRFYSPDIHKVRLCHYCKNPQWMSPNRDQ